MNMKYNNIKEKTFKRKSMGILTETEVCAHVKQWKQQLQPDSRLCIIISVGKWSDRSIFFKKNNDRSILTGVMFLIKK